MKVLVVADSSARRDIRKHLLAQPGVKAVCEADSVFETLAREGRAEFDLVVCAATRNSDGLQSVRALRKRQKDVPILMIADGDNRAAIIAAIRSGCSDYLLAPVSATALRAKLEKWAGVHMEAPTSIEASLSEFCIA